jgi:hypothetical protein
MCITTFQENLENDLSMSESKREYTRICNAGNSTIASRQISWAAKKVFL